MDRSAGTHHLAGLQHLALRQQAGSGTTYQYQQDSVALRQQPIISEQLVNIPQAPSSDSQLE
jgi:hypothetical protein